MRPRRSSRVAGEGASDGSLGAAHAVEAGGTGDGFLYYACVNEEIGRSHWAQLVFGCQAPDAGNAELLHRFGTPDQRTASSAPVAGRRDRSSP